MRSSFILCAWGGQRHLQGRAAPQTGGGAVDTAAKIRKSQGVWLVYSLAAQPYTADGLTIRGLWGLVYSLQHFSG